MNVEERIGKYLKENVFLELLYDKHTIKQEMKNIKNGINAPFINVGQYLGDEDEIIKTIYIRISLDDIKVWNRDKYFKSRYLTFVLHNDFIKNNLTLWKKSDDISIPFRKCKVKSIDNVIKKINTYIKRVE